PPHILLALVASILIHATAFSAFTEFVRPRHHVTPPDLYIYVTRTSSQHGIARVRGNELRTSGRESDKFLAKISRHPARLNRAPRHRGKLTGTRLALESHEVETWSLTKSIPSPPRAARARDNNAVPLLRNEEGSSGLRPNDSIANRWPDATSGTIVDQPPVLVSRTLPAYPERARRLGIE